MKMITASSARLAFAVCLFASVLRSSMAQDSAPYTEGSVWQVSFIKIKPGQDDEYLKSLKTSWQTIADEMKKEGYIVSSKILYGQSASPQDFDLILMFEVKNMAALDGYRAKEDAVLQKVFGSNFEQASKDLAAKRVEMREIYGSKLLREITLK
jgi:hypothetical protein